MDDQRPTNGQAPPSDEAGEDDSFDPFVHATVPRNLYSKFQIEGSKRFGPPTEILPFLFLGSCFCANERELLLQLGVTRVLNVAEECPPPPLVSSKEVVKQYMMIDVVEHIRKNDNQWNTFEACFTFIDKARVAYEGKEGEKGKQASKSKKMSLGRAVRLSLKPGKNKENEQQRIEPVGEKEKILVHCMHGRSRSATILIAYLMKKEKWTLREAYVHVKLRRPIVGPDKHLKKQLIDYEKHLFGKTSFQTVDEFRDFQVQLTPQIGNGKETKENEEEEQDVIPPNKEGIKENPEESPLQ